MSYKAVREISGVAALYRHRQSLQQLCSLQLFSAVTPSQQSSVDLTGCLYIVASHLGPSVSTATGTKW